MRQYKLIAIILFAFSALAVSPEPTNATYEEFQRSKDQFLAMKLTQKDFSKKFKELDSQLTALYEKLKASESEELSVEGNQMALDLELLEPLRQLANSKFDKAACREARHSNQMNVTPEDKEQNDVIEKVIQSICK
ncbi:MAG: hypothetical protein A2622_07660 [Bdellovibrionales bacterium RIFCSPHIGHO2_01_FULL_40_29]|nr:MAG: hypothetical protein A2622_07660 [Bdellovibrionales bacterium RIFCSPHIGHO2_01_FULL_40_29]OFZ34203.1 MAG: hypothetical protein A3D17_03990 [Bdellovibrionales bacterium RIFCSPHIGHO2_02_FULL_40_15]